MVRLQKGTAKPTPIKIVFECRTGLIVGTIIKDSKMPQHARTWARGREARVDTLYGRK